MPVEALIILHNQFDALSARHEKRRTLLEETADFYGVSVSTVRRALRLHHQPQAVYRKDYNEPRVIRQSEMKCYCELIAALKLRTTNKKGRHLSTKECIRILEDHGVETSEGLVQTPKGLLKRSTVSRYLNRWGYDQRSMTIEPPAIPFQAIHSNDCWQFDFSSSELKKLKNDPTDSVLMLASVVDDRSGVGHQEYAIVKGEDTMTALRFLFNAMAPKTHKDCPFQGIPKMLYIDNGAFARSKLFRRVMALLGVEVRTHMPRNTDGRRTTARAKGKVERSFRTIKDMFETLYHFHEPETLDEANEWLRQYLIRYNQMPHRSEHHSRMEDWIKHLPPEGFREMCSWERFCSFAREPENRKADNEACVSIDGIRYQLDYSMAGQDVILLWGLFDNELFVEFNQEKHGPFYPTTGPIQLGTFRKPKKSATEKRADRIGELAKNISVPRSALSGEKESVTSLLKETNALHTEPLPSVPFVDADPFDCPAFKNKIEAKTAIAGFLGHPLARLSSVQMDEINRILDDSLDKARVMVEIRTYFTLSLKNQTGDDSCTGK
ncbi:MAG TPA: IS481 family transposase [Cellvibrio sp.]|nr:IS481 family transposase [Cellvibrio sp.]